MSRKELTISTTILFAIAITFGLSSCKPAAEATPLTKAPLSVKVITVQPDNMGSFRQFPGRVIASQSANLAFKTAGQITNVSVEAGDEVKTGNLLLALDPTDYQLNVNQSQANYDLANVTFERVKSSYDKKIATKADYDNAKSKFDSAETALEQAKNQLANTKLYAPFEGVVVNVHAQNYDFVSTGQPVLVLQSVDGLQVKFQVPSTIVAKIKRQYEDVQASTVDVRFDLLGDELYTGVVSEFSPASDASTRGFNVLLDIPQPPKDKGLLLPGMDATINMDLKKQNDQNDELTVPIHAVFQHQQQSKVWTIVDNRVVATNVTTGMVRGSQIDILEGLTPGDQVVSAGIHRLVDGQTIIVWSGE